MRTSLRDTCIVVCKDFKSLQKKVKRKSVIGHVIVSLTAAWLGFVI